MAEPKPTLSVIVTTYALDRLKDIGELLDSIQNQTYNNTMEIIFVVEQSTELLNGIKGYIDGKSIPNARIIFNPDKLGGICAARNLGIKEAQGDIIAFTDDDALPFPDWAEEMVKTYEDDSIIGVTGPAFPLWVGEYVGWFPEEFYWIIGGTAWFDCDEMREVRNVWGMNMSFRKEAFALCQFSENLGISRGAHKSGKVGLVGDDTELSLNLSKKTGRPIVYNPKVKVRHRVYSYRLTPRFIQRQAYWQGYTKAVFKKLYGNGDKNEKVLETEYRLLRQIILKLLPGIVRSFFSHPIVAWKRLHLTIMVLFHLTLGYFSAVSPKFGMLTRSRYSSH